jgi:hypothetical protein
MVQLSIWQNKLQQYSIFKQSQPVELLVRCALDTTANQILELSHYLLMLFAAMAALRGIITHARN